MQLLQDIAKPHILFTFSVLAHLRHRKCSDPSDFGALQGNWILCATHAKPCDIGYENRYAYIYLLIYWHEITCMVSQHYNSNLPLSYTILIYHKCEYIEVEYQTVHSVHILAGSGSNNSSFIQSISILVSIIVRIQSSFFNGLWILANL